MIMVFGDTLCACGHGFGDHFVTGTGCEICADNGDFYIHIFTQDNLNYIEDVARQKGLV